MRVREILGVSQISQEDFMDLRDYCEGFQDMNLIKISEFFSMNVVSLRVDNSMGQIERGQSRVYIRGQVWTDAKERPIKCKSDQEKQGRPFLNDVQIQ